MSGIGQVFRGWLSLTDVVAIISASKSSFSAVRNQIVMWWYDVYVAEKSR